MTPNIWKAYLCEEDKTMIKEMRLKTKKGLAIGSDMFVKKAE